MSNKNIKADLDEIFKGIKKHGGKMMVARCCGVTNQAVLKWVTAGRLPRTEWTGETQYSKLIFDEFGVVVPPFVAPSCEMEHENA